MSDISVFGSFNSAVNATAAAHNTATGAGEIAANLADQFASLLQQAEISPVANNNQIAPAEPAAYKPLGISTTADNSAISQATLNQPSGQTPQQQSSPNPASNTSNGDGVSNQQSQANAPQPIDKSDAATKNTANNQNNNNPSGAVSNNQSTQSNSGGTSSDAAGAKGNPGNSNDPANGNVSAEKNISASKNNSKNAATSAASTAPSLIQPVIATPQTSVAAQAIGNEIADGQPAGKAEILIGAGGKGSSTDRAAANATNSATGLVSTAKNAATSGSLADANNGTASTNATNIANDRPGDPRAAVTNGTDASTKVAAAAVATIADNSTTVLAATQTGQNPATAKNAGTANGRSGNSVTIAAAGNQAALLNSAGGAANINNAVNAKSGGAALSSLAVSISASAIKNGAPPVGRIYSLAVPNGSSPANSGSNNGQGVQSLPISTGFAIPPETVSEANIITAISDKAIASHTEIFAPATASNNGSFFSPSVFNAAGAPPPVSTASANQPVVVRAPDQAAPAVNQVAFGIGQAAGNGIGKITVELHPVSLGRVNLELSVDKDGHISAAIAADHPATLALLRQDSHQLHQALHDAGFQTNSNSLNFSLRGEGNANGQSGQQNADGTPLSVITDDAANTIDNSIAEPDRVPVGILDLSI